MANKSNAWTTIQVKKSLHVPDKARKLAKLIEREMPAGTSCSIGSAVSVAVEEALKARSEKSS